MNTLAQTFSGVLALVAAAGTITLIVGRFAGGPLERLARWLIKHRILVAAAVGVIATLGSLYFSEIEQLEPCRYCWFQRVFMYPIAIIGPVAVWRRDEGARWYLGALAAIGGMISTYHTVLEWNPQLESDTCALFGPACTVVYFRTFGFLSLATMALCGFAFVLTLSLVNFSTSQDDL